MLSHSRGFSSSFSSSSSLPSLVELFAGISEFRGDSAADRNHKSTERPLIRRECLPPQQHKFQLQLVHLRPPQASLSYRIGHPSYSIHPEQGESVGYCAMKKLPEFLLGHWWRGVGGVSEWRGARQWPPTCNYYEWEVETIGRHL